MDTSCAARGDYSPKFIYDLVVVSSQLHHLCQKHTYTASFTTFICNKVMVIIFCLILTKESGTVLSYVLITHNKTFHDSFFETVTCL